MIPPPIQRNVKIDNPWVCSEQGNSFPGGGGGWLAGPGMRPVSGWQTHGSNIGDPLAPAVIWESISFLPLSRYQAWLVGFQTWEQRRRPPGFP